MKRILWDDFLDSSIGVAETIFDAKCYAYNFIAEEGLELLGETDAGIGVEEQIYFPKELTVRLQKFIDGKYKSAASIKKIRGDLLTVFHELIHTIGPERWPVWDKISTDITKNSCGWAFSEGATELAAQIFFDEYLKGLDLERIDKRVLIKSPEKVCYPMLLNLMGTLCDWSSVALGIESEEILKRWIKDGTGARPLLQFTNSFIRRFGLEKAKEIGIILIKTLSLAQTIQLAKKDNPENSEKLRKLLIEKLAKVVNLRGETIISKGERLT